MTHVRVAIVGSGFGGIGTAIRLRQRGTTDFVILERRDAIGGVWRDNVYPDAACDVPSHLYSLSFAPKPDWSHAYARQPEILAYLERCVSDFDLAPHLRLGHELLSATWDRTRARWQLETTVRRYSADLLVLGAGALSDAAIPDLPGLDQFAGKKFHSASWDRDYPLSGKRVAVIGTGASAIQFVPALQRQVARLFVFQRTPPWITSRRDRPFGVLEQRVMAYRAARLARRAVLYATREAVATAFFSLRGARLMQWVAERHLRTQVRDPALRRKLTPSYATGCKRVLLSDDYYPAVASENVELVTEGIARIHPHAVETVDGRRREVDALVFGTGFQVRALPILARVHGRDGRTLAETWSAGMSAHLGITVAGFPNLFFLQGPHTGLGHTSVLIMIEAQIEHVLRALDHLDETGYAAMEPRPEVQAAFTKDVGDKLQDTVWLSGGCKSWYLDERGQSRVMWPGYTFTYTRRVEDFQPSDYVGTEHPR